MSEIKPVSIKTAVERYDEIDGSDAFEFRRGLCIMNECLALENKELRAALEALQNNLDYMKNCADELLSENNNILRENEILKAENASQVNEIIGLRNDLESAHARNKKTCKN